ncbi:glycosyltransferase family 2 protein [Actinomycetospora lemnae]|uniref:Glycosyltransferase family A protein n=1 Tax=Actinomycetospora lemnae TaxID=3019891 RepID=A0ABT5SV94_9PSEU|nr:glycosyltransferase family A protein [Actinomycetospora sp. DW7H6]MDD7966714.1 glycosyltransferase family A protein [Actinomycetospora sp. DW7H6]
MSTTEDGAVPDSRADDRPVVSFLCPAYKTERYLPGTIASVLAQTRTDWELVVVDNGMSDAIRDIVEAADDPRVVLVRQENAGFAGGVGAAVAAASGRNFAQLNSDDRIVPEYVERMAGLLEAHPEVDAVVCDALVLDERTNSYRPRSFFQQHGVRGRLRFTDRLTLPQLIDGRVIYYTAIVRREVWERAGGIDGLGDLPMWLRIVGSGADVRTIPDRLGIYMIRDDSLSRNPESIAAFQRFQEQAYLDAATGSADPAVHEALARRLRRLRYFEALRHARNALLNGDAGEARARADEALQMRTRPRSLAVAGAVRVAPHAVAGLWPLKQRVTTSGKRAVATLRGRTQKEESATAPSGERQPT